MMKLSFSFLKIILSASLLFGFETAVAQDAKFYFNKADTFYIKYTVRGNYDSAILYYTKAIQLDNNFAIAYAKRGFTYLTKKDGADAAIRDCSKAISLMPDSFDLSETYYYRGEAYSKKEFYDSAIADFTNSLAYRGDNKTELFDIYNGRFNAYYKSGQFELARPDIDKIIQLKPKFPGYYNNRGVCYNSMGEYKLAIQDYLTSLINKTHNTSGNAYFNIISPLVRLKRFDDAVLFYNLYFRNRVDNNLKSFLYGGTDTLKYRFYKYFLKAVVQVNENNLQDALTNLDSASIEYYTGIKEEQTKRLYVDILALNGYILEKLGRYNDAKVTYEQSMVIAKRQPDIAEALTTLQSKITLTRSTDLDKEKPEIPDLKASPPIPVSADSVITRITGTANDKLSGIQTLLINNSISITAEMESDGYFKYNLKRKKGDSSAISVKVIDSANNERTYTIRYNPNTRGGDVEVTSSNKGSAMGTYHAILIAENDYMNFRKLYQPINDAENLRNILVNKFTFDAINIDTLFNRSREDILETIIAKGKSLGKNDNLLIFYAGHGDTTRDVNDEIDGYLVPTTAKKNRTSSYISSPDIQKALMKSNAKHILMVLDACYSGALTRSNDSITASSDIWNQWSQPSRKVMTSGNYNEAVSDKSIFIRYFTEYLEQPRKEKHISTSDIWKFVDDNVRKDPRNEEIKTTPQYQALKHIGDKGGQFIFVRR
jgi:tetratricopeptide (TPR) repeat protein